MATTTRKVIFFDDVKFTYKDNPEDAAPVSELMDTDRGIYFSPMLSSDKQLHITHGGKIYTLGSDVETVDSESVITLANTVTTDPKKVIAASDDIKIITNITAQEFDKKIVFSYSLLDINTLIDTINNLSYRVTVAENTIAYYHGTLKPITPNAPTAVSGLMYDGNSHQLINQTDYSFGYNTFKLSTEGESDWKTAVESVVATNAGKYTVDWKANIMPGYEKEYCLPSTGASGTVEVTIEQKPATANIELSEDMSMSSATDYQHQLIESVTIPTDLTGEKVYLFVTSDSSYTPSSESSIWILYEDATTLSNSALETTSAGTWYVWYYTEAPGDNYAGVGPEKAGEVVLKEYEEPSTYYYYAGWTLPTSEEDLATLAVSPNGGVADMTKTYDSNNVLYDYTDNPVSGSAKAQFYVVIPNSISIYDADKNSTVDAFTLEGTIGNHNIYKSVSAFRSVNWIILF